MYLNTDLNIVEQTIIFQTEKKIRKELISSCYQIVFLLFYSNRKENIEIKCSNKPIFFFKLTNNGLIGGGEGCLFVFFKDLVFLIKLRYIFN